MKPNDVPRTLVRYDQARQALAEAHRIDEVKDIADKAVALAAYARQAKDADMERWVAEIRLRARRRIGELTADLPDGRGKSSTAETFKRDALNAAGITKVEAHRCEQLARVPEEKFESYIAQKAEQGRPVVADEVARLVVKKERQRAATVTMAETARCTVEDLAAAAAKGLRFGTIYADPPWLYTNQGTRAATGNHYPGMTVEEICALPVAPLLAESAHCHLWTTNAFLFEAHRVLEAWGFEYRSVYVWVKPQMGIGNYWRVSHEFLLFGIRGSAPFRAHDERSWGQFDRAAHSAKPEQVRALIEKVSGGPYLELFARRLAPGWFAWGNQVERAIFDQEAVA